MIKFLKLIFLALLCGIIFVSVQAQNKNKIDSLVNVLKMAKEDTNKVEVLVNLASQYLNNEPLTSLKYSKQSLALAQKLNYDRGQIQSLNNIGGYYYYTGKFDSTLFYNKAAFKFIVITGNKKELMNYYGNIGTIYSIKGDYEKSIENKLKSLKICEELKDTLKMAICTRNIGVDFANKGDFSTALNYYFNSLKLSEAKRDSDGMGSTNLCIGEIYSAEKKYDKAIKYLLNSIDICNAINNIHDASVALFDVANVYYDSGKYLEAQNYFQKSLTVSNEINNNTIIASSYNGLGRVNMQNNYPDSALFYLLKSSKMFEEMDDKERLAVTYQNIGEVYERKKNFIKAIENLNKGLAISTKIGAKDASKSCFKLLSEIYYKMKNYKLAYDYNLSYMQLNDSIHNLESTKKITEIESKYNAEKKDKEIVLLNKDKEIQKTEIIKQKQLKNFFIVGFALLLILSFFVYNNFRIANKLKLQNIRNRIASDLHDDVGSTLNSISVYSEVAKQKSPTVVNELEQIGDASRKIIEVMSDIVWTINPKNDTFENIILRMSTLAYNLLKAKNIEHTFRADESLNETKLSLESRRNFYLIFKEALNNLVKYSNATRASIILANENGLIKLAVRDNGVGFDVAQTSKGNGLLNMKTRAEEMNAQLKIESEKGSGTNVELILKR